MKTELSSVLLNLLPGKLPGNIPGNASSQLYVFDPPLFHCCLFHCSLCYWLQSLLAKEIDWQVEGKDNKYIPDAVKE